MILGELIAAEPALTKLSTLRLPIKTSYNLMKLLSNVKKEIEIFNTQRNLFIKELGIERDTTLQEKQKGMGSQVVEVLPNNIEEFVKRINELASVEVSIETNLTLESLGSIEISAEDLLVLKPILNIE